MKNKGISVDIDHTLNPDSGFDIKSLNIDEVSVSGDNKSRIVNYKRYHCNTPDNSKTAYITWDNTYMPWERTDLMLNGKRVDNEVGAPWDCKFDKNNNLFCIKEDVDTKYEILHYYDDDLKRLMPAMSNADKIKQDFRPIAEEFMPKHNTYFFDRFNTCWLISISPGQNTLYKLDVNYLNSKREGKDRLDNLMPMKKIALIPAIADVPRHIDYDYVEDKIILSPFKQFGFTTAIPIAKVDPKTGVISENTPENGLDLMYCEKYSQKEEYHNTMKRIKLNGVETFLLSPLNSNKDKYPLVIYLHPGPTSHNDPCINPRDEFFKLLNLGISVAFINYRGSTGYGCKFRQELNGNWGVAEVQDVYELIKYIINNDNTKIDKDRILVYGHSAGAFSSLMVGANVKIKEIIGNKGLAGAISHAPVVDLVKIRTDSHDFEANYPHVLIGDYVEENYDKYKLQAPTHNTQTMDCPIMIMQGNRDPVCPIEHVSHMVDKLKQKGKNIRFEILNGQGHCPGDDRQMEYNQRLIIDFIKGRLLN